MRAALLRTWLNGWCTGRCFGICGGHCFFGCRRGEDDVRHYVGCPILWQFGAATLGTADPRAPEERTLRALLWHTGASTAELASTATLIAVGYKAHTVLRRTPAPGLDVKRLFIEVYKQLGVPATAGDDE